jgi:hypothetical protein
MRQSISQSVERAKIRTRLEIAACPIADFIITHRPAMSFRSGADVGFQSIDDRSHIVPTGQIFLSQRAFPFSAGSATVPADPLLERGTEQLCRWIIGRKAIHAIRPSGELFACLDRIGRALEEGSLFQQSARRSQQRREYTIVAILVVGIQCLEPVGDVQQADQVMNRRLLRILIIGAIPDPADRRPSDAAQMQGGKDGQHRQMTETVSDIQVDTIIDVHMPSHDA